MSLITLGTVFIVFGGIFISVVAVNGSLWLFILGFIFACVGVLIQLYGEAKIEKELNDMRDEYIDLFNHSDEWITSFEQPEMFKDIEEKSINKIDTLNGNENK